MTASASMSQPMRLLTSHQSQDWYTPPWLVELVREALGGEIELDPASAGLPQTWIRAKIYCEFGSLGNQWRAKTVFCNPPYGKTVEGGQSGSNQAIWSSYMAAQFEKGNFREGILLVNSTHGYVWYENMWTNFPCCLLRERVRFIKPDGTEGGQAKRGQTLVYFGGKVERFSRVFERYGRVILP